MKTFLENTLVPPLKAVLDPLHGMLDSVPEPLWRVSVCTYLVAGALWTLWLSRESIFRGAPLEGKICDLRIWVVLLLIPYLLIYAIF